MRYINLHFTYLLTYLLSEKNKLRFACVGKMRISDKCRLLAGNSEVGQSSPHSLF